MKKVKGKVIALFVTLAFILVFVSSIDVVTLFQGSHQITDISNPSNDIDCTGCHQWVHDNLSSSAIHADLNCSACHRFTGTGIVFATHNETDVYVGEEAHAAYTPRCLDCHERSDVYIKNKTGVWVYAPPAPAFNESGYGSDVSAHKPLVNWSLGFDLSVGENEACLACHTNYSIKNEFKRPEFFDFYVDHSGSIGFYLSGIDYGPTKSTNVSKSESGAKHEFKAINQIKCEDCHSDVWQAANHTGSRDPFNTYFSTNASHLCWQWDKDGKYGDSPMHNVTCVDSEYSVSNDPSYPYTGYYDNITEFCSLSCHKPRVSSSSTAVPPVLEANVHAARRISCFDCHNSTYSFSNFYLYVKPNDGDERPKYASSGGHGSSGMFSSPLFLHADTCIACKRAGAPSKKEHFKTWTEPNNTMLHDGTPI